MAQLRNFQISHYVPPEVGFNKYLYGMSDAVSRLLLKSLGQGPMG